MADTLTDGWRSAVSRQLASFTVDEVWPRVGRNRRRLFDCAVLAGIADALEKAKEELHDAVGRLAGFIVRSAGGAEPERVLAEALARRISLPGDQEIDKIVQCLRIIGVFVCLAGGADVLRCPCLRALAKDRSKEELQAILEEKLDAVVPATC